ncbi:MAG: hypothetical protein IKQ76_04150 [Bacteroidales bacterium]|nr:hypothetical protein [Bacteroidales bacterium]
MKTLRFPFFLSVTLTAILLTACGLGSRAVVSSMDEAEALLDAHPDSALSILQQLDSTRLFTRALRGRYSLLRTMALDKNYQSITTPGLLDAALRYYARHGTPDEKMKTLYYQGRIVLAGGNQNGAAVYYFRAEEYAEKVKDRHALGLLYLSTASIYSGVSNTKREKEYIEKGLSEFRESGDPMYEQALGQLAAPFVVLQQWDVADSLYRKGIEASASNRYAQASYLASFARMKVLQPEPDPAGAIALWNRMQQDCGLQLSLRDAGAYAYALTLLGRDEDAQRLLGLLAQRAEAFPAEVEPWIGRCADARGDYQQAYMSLNRARTAEDTSIQNILSESISDAISSYQEVSANQRHQRYREYIFALTSALLFLILALVLVFARKNRLKEEKAQIQGLCSTLEEEVAEQGAQAVALQQQLKHFQEIARQERVLRFRQAGRLRSSIWRLDNLGVPSWFIKDPSLAAMKEELSYVYDIDDSGEKLLGRMDRELGGVIAPLLDRLHLKGHPQEQLLLACCLLDLPSDLIGTKLGITPNNVRVRKHRLKEQIAKLNDENLDALFGVRR